MQIITNARTGKPMIIQNKLYREFEKECGYYLNQYNLGIDYPINLKCIFYRDNKRRIDLCNLLEAICDILTKYHVIQDDNRNIIASTNGSMVLYDKNNPRIEIEITPVLDYEKW